jgi:hypothetical protein
MTVDPLEVPRLALADFGETLAVIPVAGGDAFDIQVLCDETVEQTSLGNSRQSYGGMADTRFFCLPEEGERLSEGDTLTDTGGTVYRVFEIIPHRQGMTEIRVVEP